jgi:hypothetical protein
MVERHCWMCSSGRIRRKITKKKQNEREFAVSTPLNLLLLSFCEPLKASCKKNEDGIKREKKNGGDKTLGQAFYSIPRLFTLHSISFL